MTVTFSFMNTSKWLWCLSVTWTKSSIIRNLTIVKRLYLCWVNVPLQVYSESCRKKMDKNCDGPKSNGKIGLVSQYGRVIIITGLILATSASWLIQCSNVAPNLYKCKRESSNNCFYSNEDHFPTSHFRYSCSIHSPSTLFITLTSLIVMFVLIHICPTHSLILYITSTFTTLILIYFCVHLWFTVQFKLTIDYSLHLHTWLDAV